MESISANIPPLQLQWRLALLFTLQCMSPDVSPFSPFFPLSHQICRFVLHHYQNRLTKIPSISKICRFSTSPPPPQSKFFRSRLKSPQPPCFLTGSRISYAHNSPIIVFSPCPTIETPPELLISLPLVQPSDLLFVIVVLNSLSPTPNVLPLSLPIQPLVLFILLPFTGCGTLDHGLTLIFFLLICYSIHVLVLFVFCLSGVPPCDVWTRFCWLIFSRPVCSIEIEEVKGIVFFGLNLCYPHDLWFFSIFEMSCFDLKWRIDCWLFDWSQLLFPEDLVLLFFYPGHLMGIIV